MKQKSEYHHNFLQVEENDSIESFIKRFFGDNFVLEKYKQTEISKDIHLQVLYLQVLPIAELIEEKAIINFCPYEDGAYYINISFFPECKNGDEKGYHILRLIYHPDFFSQWSDTLLNRHQPFQFDRSSEQAFYLNEKTKNDLEYLGLHLTNSKDFIVALQRQQAAISLLQHALKLFIGAEDSHLLPACKFIDDSSERTKILNVEQIILNRLDNPLSLKEIAREAGLNECYLKKGFKSIFGKTVLEFQQAKRIEKAKELIKQGQLTINEVAFIMGFSSPSYFSTAFKKVTGMKPCELLG